MGPSASCSSAKCYANFGRRHHVVPLLTQNQIVARRGMSPIDREARCDPVGNHSANPCFCLERSSIDGVCSPGPGRVAKSPRRTVSRTDLVRSGLTLCRSMFFFWYGRRPHRLRLLHSRRCNLGRSLSLAFGPSGRCRFLLPCTRFSCGIYSKSARRPFSALRLGPPGSSMQTLRHRSSADR